MIELKNKHDQTLHTNEQETNETRRLHKTGLVCVYVCVCVCV